GCRVQGSAGPGGGEQSSAGVGVPSRYERRPQCRCRARNADYISDGAGVGARFWPLGPLSATKSGVHVIGVADHDVRYWHKADIAATHTNVRFWGNSGHWGWRLGEPRNVWKNPRKIRRSATNKIRDL